jgi:hypothetical protein
MAPAVSTSSGTGGFPAEAQCAQLLSHANVHRQGKMYKGPLRFNESNSNKLLEKCYIIKANLKIENDHVFHHIRLSCQDVHYVLPHIVA